MWFVIAFAILYFYVLYKERQALGCPNIPNGTDCDNANGKAVKGTDPSTKDSTSTIFDKIVKAADFGNRWVMWRIGFLLSVPCILLIHFITKGGLPTPREFVVGTFVITALVYFTLNFYKFHLINHVQSNIDEGVDILRARV
jgi:RsiW-degrading membrane proteinase PrsW (M82 family)